jgi:hypothetical protein
MGTQRENWCQTTAYNSGLGAASAKPPLASGKCLASESSVSCHFVPSRKMTIFHNAFYCMVVLFVFALSAYSECIINVCGSPAVSLNNKRSDLLLGLSSDYIFSKWFTLMLSGGYSFRHQISNSNESRPFMLVADKSTNTIIGEYDIEEYRESGYCFVFKFNPKFTFNNVVIGFGNGIEAGTYTSSAKLVLRGQGIGNSLALSNNSIDEHNIIFFANMGYKFDPILLSVEAQYREDKNILLGISFDFPIFTLIEK